jgi:hypothetical protein
MGIAQMQVRGAAAATFARARLRAARTPGRTRSASGRQTESAQGTRQAAKLTRPATARAAPASAATVRGRGGGVDGLKRPRARAHAAPRAREARQRARKAGAWAAARTHVCALLRRRRRRGLGARARRNVQRTRRARNLAGEHRATRSKAARETTFAETHGEFGASARGARAPPSPGRRPAFFHTQCIITQRWHLLLPLARPSLCHSSHPLTYRNCLLGFLVETSAIVRFAGS